MDGAAPSRRVEPSTAGDVCFIASKPITLTECMQQASKALDRTIAEIAAMGDARETTPECGHKDLTVPFMGGSCSVYAVLEVIGFDFGFCG